MIPVSAIAGVSSAPLKLARGICKTPRAPASAQHSCSSAHLHDTPAELMMEKGPVGLGAEVTADFQNAPVGDQAWRSFRKPVDFFDRFDGHTVPPVTDFFRCHDDPARRKGFPCSPGDSDENRNEADHGYSDQQPVVAFDPALSQTGKNAEPGSQPGKNKGGDDSRGQRPEKRTAGPVSGRDLVSGRKVHDLEVGTCGPSTRRTGELSARLGTP